MLHRSGGGGPIVRTCSALVLVLVLAVVGCAEPEPRWPALDTSLRPDTPTEPTMPASRDDPPVGDTPPGAHASQIPATLAPVDAARIIVLGDTPSAGGGAPTEDTYPELLSQNDDDAWPDDADHDLETMMGTVPEVLRLAVYNANAATTEQVQLPELSMLLGDTVSGHSIVVMTVGIHDVLTEVLSDDSAIRPAALDHVRNVVRYFRDPVRFPDGASIYLINVTDPTNGTGLSHGCFLTEEISGLPAAIESLNAQYLALGAELGIGIVDAHGYFMGHGFAGTLTGEGYAAGDRSPTSWFSSCVVPDERGHNELRKLLFEAIDGTYVAS